MSFPTVVRFVTGAVTGIARDVALAGLESAAGYALEAVDLLGGSEYRFPPEPPRPVHNHLRPVPAVPRDLAASMARHPAGRDRGPA